MDIHPPSLVGGEHEGRRLELRPPCPRDAPALVEAIHASVRQLRVFMAWAHHDNTVEQQYTRLVDVQRDYWGEGDKVFHLWSGTRMLGCFGVHQRTLNARGGELGYWVRSDEAGHGVGTFAARMATVVCFEHFELERVQLLYNAANHGSRRIAEKCGFRIEGRLQRFETAPTDAMLQQGATPERSHVITALLRDEVESLPWYAAFEEATEIRAWDS